eukprot:2405218-Pleurochrysis_carterae.AAC.1
MLATSHSSAPHTLYTPNSLSTRWHQSHTWHRRLSELHTRSALAKSLEAILYHESIERVSQRSNKS